MGYCRGLMRIAQGPCKKRLQVPEVSDLAHLSWITFASAATKPSSEPAARHHLIKECFWLQASWARSGKEL